MGNIELVNNLRARSLARLEENRFTSREELMDLIWKYHELDKDFSIYVSQAMFIDLVNAIVIAQDFSYAVFDAEPGKKLGMYCGHPMYFLEASSKIYGYIIAKE